MGLKQCCATGSLHTGTPKGRIEKVHGLDCYIADAPSGSPKGIVIIIPDAFGWELPNNRILADEYAKNGNFQVVSYPQVSQPMSNTDLEVVPTRLHERYAGSHRHYE
jgi:hypothetical protein